MDPSWEPPKRGYVKVNIRASSVAEALQNGNVNGVGILARDHRAKYLWGIMGPMRGVGFLELQLWAIRKAVITAYRKKIPRVVLETDNAHAYEILLEQDGDMLEEEGLEEVVRQINNLSRTYNHLKQDDGTRWDCELKSVHASRNRTTLCMAQHGMSNCNSLVEVPVPFEDLQEHLEMDMSFGPNADFLEVQPNFGEGEILEAPPTIDLSSEDDEDDL
ncbi:hypothetical protein ACET3Z_031722 [Daucus carota]